ncbi:MAG: 23S rRNA (cytidine(2498)-2'-O)-methyltransferase RlmM [Pseudomonadota bacterium]
MGKPETPAELLCYCRAGFESDLAAELAARAAAAGVGAYPRYEEDGGFVRFLPAGTPFERLSEVLPLDALVFARQCIPALEPLSGLPRDDRLTPLVERVAASDWAFEHIWHETPDTNAGKGLQRLARALERPLESVMRKRGQLRRQAHGWRLHCFWSRGDTVQPGLCQPGACSDRLGGILRLRASRAAPSRSALKLEEAWYQFLPAEDWGQRLAEGMTAVDLGAAPGGWTWQLVRRGMYVHAVDNGPMNADLMATGQVEHHRADAFGWQPPAPVNWLVCDIVDKPARVTARIADWLVAGWCREAIFNLKLPMRRRWQTVEDCLAHLRMRLEEAEAVHHLRARQLYHDREEITVHVRLE